MGEAERFFKEFLNHQPNDYQPMSLHNLQNLLSYRCSVEDQVLLTKNVNAEEIQKLLFSMPNNQAQTDSQVSFLKLHGI